MKLMGTPKLRELATSGVDGMSGAAAALWAELEAASWECAADVADQFPAAHIDGCCIRIPMGETHRVDLIANYDAGMILIDYAGLARKAAEVLRPKGRKAT